MQRHRLLRILPLLAPICAGCRNDGAIVDTLGSSGTSSESTSPEATLPPTSESPSSIGEPTTADTPIAADSSSSETIGGSSESPPPNTPPTPADDVFGTTVGLSFVAVAFTDSVLLNDSDVDGDALTVVPHLGLET